jgi:hypothetical protein
MPGTDQVRVLTIRTSHVLVKVNVSSMTGVVL